MNINSSEMDPLNTYDYPYSNHDNHRVYLPHFSYNIKPEYAPNTHYNTALNPPTFPTPIIPNDIQTSNIPTNVNNSNVPNENSQNVQVKPTVQNDENTEEVDTKEHIKLLPDLTKRKKGKGKTSAYWNKKIQDANFPFYGCTICNISFQKIQDLDQHVTIHKGRLTSYDIRLRNRSKKKQLKKEQKRLKKLSKSIKNEFPVEIKPEDGYIGNEKASEFMQNNENLVNNTNIDGQTKQEVLKNENSDSQNEHDSQTVHKNSLTKNNDSQNVQNSSRKVNTETSEDNKEITSEDPRLQKLFKCFACQKQFSLSYYLKLHVRSHTDEKPYTCSECGQSFITASKLGRHNKRIHLAIRYQCRICYRFFSRFEYLTRHFDKKHAEEKLEGEPYDYNAILPYLKELEEELREKAEKERQKTEDQKPEEQKTADPKAVDQKPKSEDLWSDSLVFQHSYNVEKKEDLGNLPLSDTIKEDKDLPPVNILIVEMNGNNQGIKEEKVDPEVDGPTEQGFVDFADHHSTRGDDSSDEDYFPSNTWAATPKVELSPPSPQPKRKRGNYPLKCEQCSKVIKTPSYMRVHMRTHTGEKPFRCYVCNRGFITASKMHRHVLTHNENEDDENKVKVEETDIKTEEGEDNQENGAKKKKGKTKSKTKTGKAILPQKSTEKRKREHACPYCNKRFLHAQTMQVHLKSHEGEDIIWKCNYCLEIMATEEMLKEHESTHSGPRPYICTICSRTYTKKETMVYHRKSHGPESGQSDTRREYICDICSKTFNAQCKLQRHIVGHKTERFILKYECPVCAHMFNTKYHIQMHLATHQKEGLILEENRSEILAMVLQNARKIPKQTNKNLSSATELMQPDERSRVCNICGEVFQHFYYLEEHLKSHGSKIAIENEEATEEKKHICQVCNKGFKLHYYLKLHSFTHTKEKPFICQQCGKGFITKGKLKRHLETHAGLKKFQCHICYKFFTRTSYLRIHVRTIHGTQDYNFKQFFNNM